MRDSEHGGTTAMQAEEWRETAALALTVSAAVTQSGDLGGILQQCADALVTHIDVALARIWVIDPHGQELVLRASAGMYRHLDGAHGRIAVGRLKIGRIAATRTPHLTNELRNDPNIDDPAWAQREGLIAFAGYPLIAADEVVGVLAVFARRPLGPAILESMRAVADRIALLIRQRTADEERWLLTRHLQLLLESTDEGMFGLDMDGRCTFVNRAAAELLGYEPDALRGQPMHALLHPEHSGDGEPHAQCPIVRALREGRGVRVDADSFRRRDGRVLPVSCSSHPITEDGRVTGAVVTFADVTARERAERERAELLARERQAREDAEAARASAERANHAKSQFLATMSHEIRTPINAIVGYTDLIRAGLAGQVTDLQKGYLERIRASSLHLNALIDEVLDLAKIESGRLHVGHEPVELRPAVLAALSLVTPQAAARGLSLVDETRALGGTLYVGDEGRVRQILVNLLANAVKFTEPGGRITLRAGVCESLPAPLQLRGIPPWLFVEVEDTGIGIDESHLADVFDPFVQVDSGHTRTHGGTGLGLTISRRLAQLMGGDITVQSTPGAGSRFTLWLQAVGAAALPARHCHDDDARSRTAGLQGLARVGEHLSHITNDVVAALAARLRVAPEVPMARALRAVELEDHIPTFLADLARALVILEETRGEPSTIMRDGTEVQRLISQRHGRQRRSLGWSAFALQREYELLAEEVRRAVERGATAYPEASLEEALAVLNTLIELASAIALRGFEEEPTPAP